MQKFHGVMRVVSRQAACQGCAAFHASGTRVYLEPGYFYKGGGGAQTLGFLSHERQHLRNIAMRVGAAIDEKDTHDNGYCLLVYVVQGVIACQRGFADNMPCRSGEADAFLQAGSVSLCALSAGVYFTILKRAKRRSSCLLPAF